MAGNGFNFQGKVAVVTGGSRGIGKAVVTILAGKGCRVAAIARSSPELQQTVGGLIEKNLVVKAIHCDLNDETASQVVCQQLITNYKKIDILINCAGVGAFGPLVDLSSEQAQAPVRVPLQAAISLCQGLLPSMMDNGQSRIINLISPAAYFDLPYMSAYTASRAGLLSFTRALDEEVRSSGVRVRSVCPAWVDTEYIARNQTDENWLPKIAKYFPTISAEKAAEHVVKAITGHRREIKLSFLLQACGFCYRWFPVASVASFKLMGLYQPPALTDNSKNTEGSNSWSNWEESIALKPEQIVFPESAEQVSDIVKDQTMFPSPLRAAGSRHSTTHCGVTDGGTLMIMRKMDRIINIDSIGMVVTVEAGALYIDVAKALQKQRLQFYVNVEIGNLTLGSAASTGTKDASMAGENGQVCSYCVAVKMVMANGDVRHITEAEPELMQAVRSSYGLLGVIVETTFSIRSMRPMKVSHKTYSLDQFEQALPDLRQSNQSMMYYLFPFQNDLTVEFRQYLDVEVQHYSRWLWWIRNLFWKTIAPAWGFVATNYVTNHKIRYQLIDGFYRLIQFILNKVLASKHTAACDQIIRYPSHKNFSKYTFSIWAFAEDDIMPTMRAYYQFCQDYYRDHGFRCDMLNVGYRIAKDQNPLFSYSFSNTVMTLDPVTTGGPGWDQFLRAYNEFCSSHKGVPLFNQSKWLTPAQVSKAFGGRVFKFKQVRQGLDPKNRFLNQFFKDLFQSGDFQSRCGELEQQH